MPAEASCRQPKSSMSATFLVMSWKRCALVLAYLAWEWGPWVRHHPWHLALQQQLLSIETTSSSCTSCSVCRSVALLVHACRLVSQHSASTHQCLQHVLPTPLICITCEIQCGSPFPPQSLQFALVGIASVCAKLVLFQVPARSLQVATVGTVFASANQHSFTAYLQLQRCMLSFSVPFSCCLCRRLMTSSTSTAKSSASASSLERQVVASLPSALWSLQILTMLTTQSRHWTAVRSWVNASGYVVMTISVACRPSTTQIHCISGGLGAVLTRVAVLSHLGAAQAAW